jgi:hypothetical protein
MFSKGSGEYLTGRDSCSDESAGYHQGSLGREVPVVVELVIVFVDDEVVGKATDHQPFVAACQPPLKRHCELLQESLASGFELR